MSETVLSDLPRSVCDVFVEVLPNLKECKPHAGKFSLEELKRKGLPSPAVLVSILGGKQDTTFGSGAPSFMLQMAAYVVVKDGLGKPRDIRAANICQAILSLVPGKVWGQEALGQAQDVSMHTLVSTRTKDSGVSLWAVTWNQPVSFFVSVDAPLGVELYAGQAPAIGIASVEEYTQAGGPQL